jgi:hypothetical protein
MMRRLALIALKWSCLLSVTLVPGVTCSAVVESAAAHSDLRVDEGNSASKSIVTSRPTCGMDTHVEPCHPLVPADDSNEKEPSLTELISSFGIVKLQSLALVKAEPMALCLIGYRCAMSPDVRESIVAKSYLGASASLGCPSAFLLLYDFCKAGGNEWGQALCLAVARKLGLNPGEARLQELMVRLSECDITQAVNKITVWIEDNKRRISKARSKRDFTEKLIRDASFLWSQLKMSPPLITPDISLLQVESIVD